MIYLIIILKVVYRVLEKAILGMMGNRFFVIIFLVVFSYSFFLVRVFGGEGFGFGAGYLEYSYLEDSKLSDLEYKRKYIRQWDSIDGLIEAYRSADGIYDRLFLMERLCFFISQGRVFNFVMSELSSGLLLGGGIGGGVGGGIDLTWKLRATIFRLLGRSGASLDGVQSLAVLKRAKEFFEKDSNSRVVVSSAFTLVRLSFLGILDSSLEHRLFKKRTIAYIFSDRLFLLKGSSYFAERDYLVWGIASACLELGDSFVCYALEELRKERLGVRVLEELDRVVRELKG